MWFFNSLYDSVPWELIHTPDENITLRKIEEFTRLGDGWHYGEGLQIKPETALLAEKLHTHADLKGFWKTGAFPGLQGEIVLTIYEDEHYLEFTINEDETVDFVRELGDEETDTRNEISLADSEAIISNLRKELCSSLGSSIQNSMTMKRNDLQASSTTPTEALQGYPSFLVTA